MTSGISGSSGNSFDPALQAQLAQNNQAAGAAKSGDAKKTAGNAGAGDTEAAAGFEDLISNSTETGKTSKQEGTSQTKKSAKNEKAGATSSNSSVSSASKTATAQAVKAPKGPAQNNYELPKLPVPDNTSVDGVRIKKGMGTLALLGLIMTMLAQASAKSWQSSFQQQNQAIQNQVAMAPEIGNAIRTQADHQAAATQAQATQSLISGITNIAGFALSAGIGIMSVSSKLGGLKSAAFKSETASAKGASAAASAASSSAMKATSSLSSAAMETVESAGKAVGSAAKGAAAAGSAASKAMGTLDDVAASTSKATAAATSKGSSAFSQALNNPGWKDKFARGMNVAKVQGGRAAKMAGEAFMKAAQASQMIHVVTAGVDGIAGYVYQSQVAAHQKAAGAAEAQSAMLQQYASVQDKYASQAGSLADKASESFTSALQTLQNIADSQTQTTSAIFN
ncbi:type III secretion system translocon subunit SctE [Chlamydiifrater volucris]|uniref:type III secretion system translocon subunit SctE n=1 Tax=Chlamydiifrater volucris TaxID=2681470 RepID=UPI001BCEA4C7|nr:type III secretion system translocon subunit SctE [Chlamydiifrater volucris]